MSIERNDGCFLPLNGLACGDAYARCYSNRLHCFPPGLALRELAASRASRLDGTSEGGSGRPLSARGRGSCPCHHVHLLRVGDRGSICPPIRSGSPLPRPCLSAPRFEGQKPAAPRFLCRVSPHTLVPLAGRRGQGFPPPPPPACRLLPGGGSAQHTLPGLLSVESVPGLESRLEMQLREPLAGPRVLGGTARHTP